MGQLILMWAVAAGAYFLWKLLTAVVHRLKGLFVKHESIFTQSFIESKAFYLREFHAVPCISYIADLDTSKVVDYITAGKAGSMLAAYQRSYYNWKYNESRFSDTIFKLEHKVMIEVGHDYVEILYHKNYFEYADSLTKALTAFKAPGKAEEFEINIITQTSSGLDLKQLEIKPTQLDIAMYYNDDFADIDNLIRERLNTKADKGIILLHGLPGTGKTTYLRHLVGNITKRVLFVSPAVAGNLMNPEFIDLLIENPNAVLVIEDAENIIMDRRYSSNASVSNLLNISDGLLSDCLNVQIICTFNSAINMVDSALLRKGRLIAEYEFGKLSVKKAQQLSDHLGFKIKITKPMTLAEVTNPHDMDATPAPTQVVGFRREVMMN